MPAIQMVKGMISDCMSTLLYFEESFRIFANIVSNHEKSCPHVIFRKNVQYFRRDLRNRPIVKRQVDDFILAWKITQEIFGTKPP